jgi:hypothetical protein
MKISVKQTLSIAAASCLALAGSAIAAPPGGSGPRGNSSFGMGQRTDLHTGSGNSSFGRTSSENARLKSSDADDRDDQDMDRDDMKTKKIKKTKLTNPGNSAFGRSQRINHLRGSGNNIHGKTTSANAKLKNADKKNHD